MKDSYYYINYSVYAKQKRELQNFKITLEHPEEISTLIHNIPQNFICNFSFFEEKNHACIKYNIYATIKLICQNTLEPFDYDFKVSNSIIIVEDDRLTTDSLNEPFICEKSVIDLRDILKEEILLDLPLVPKKDSNTCKNVKKHSYYSEQENVTKEKKNPFEILKNLKTT
ncbi:YceD family protein [Francisella sp. SYW-9]|uniref:YceD family protein n=1 Tax=Francisella sp. SYW-9 TaxID=2610888 RepID=UPI00123D78FC|nr:YceD family protein [Francisella sp. SYW-9]